MVSQITSLIQDADQTKHQSSASMAFAKGIHRWPVNSPHKGPETRKMFPFDDVIMQGWTWPQIPADLHVILGKPAPGDIVL